MRYVVMQGWGSEIESICFETESRRDAIDLYEEMHLEWFERHVMSDYAERYLTPETSSLVAEIERPYLLVRSEQGLVEY